MRYFTLAVLLAVTVIGCGGSDSSGEPGDTTVDVTTTLGADATTTTRSSDNTDDVSPLNCPELLAVASSAANAASAAITPGTGTGFEFSTEYMQEFAERAPTEIRGDLLLVAAAYDEFYTTLDDIGIDFSDPSTFASLDADKMAQLEVAAAAMDTPEMMAATTNIQSYFDRECSS